MVEAEVRIEYKKGVVDAEGESVKKALDLLGFSVKSVGTVKVYKVEIDAENPKDVLEEACKKLLANPVIQNYSVTILS